MLEKRSMPGSGDKDLKSNTDIKEKMLIVPFKEAT